MTFGEWLQQAIADMDGTYKWLAGRLEVSPVTVSRWARNERTPDLQTCARIALALNRPIREVFSYAGYEELTNSRKFFLKLEAMLLTHQLERDNAAIERMRDQLEGIYFELVGIGIESPDVKHALSYIRNELNVVSLDDQTRQEVLEAVTDGLAAYEDRDLRGGDWL